MKFGFGGSKYIYIYIGFIIPVKEIKKIWLDRLGKEKRCISIYIIYDLRFQGLEWR